MATASLLTAVVVLLLCVHDASSSRSPVSLPLQSESEASFTDESVPWTRQGPVVLRTRYVSPAIENVSFDLNMTSSSAERDSSPAMENVSSDPTMTSSSAGTDSSPEAGTVMMTSQSRAGRCENGPARSNQKDSEMLVNLVATLHWSAVTIVCENCSDCELYDTLMENLFARGRTAEVVSSAAILTKGDNCGITSDRGFIILGGSDFLKQTLKQVSRCATALRKEYLLFDTEWLLFLTGDDSASMDPEVLRGFQNIALANRSQDGVRFLWTLRHVVDDVTWSLVSSLPLPGTGHLSRQHVLPNPPSLLGGRTLRVVVKTTSYMAFVATVDGVSVYRGVLIDILDELSLRLNFTYITVPATDDSFGQEMANGQWDGPIGMLTRKEADVAVATFQITQGRSSVADHTMPILYDDAVIVFRHDSTASQSAGWTFYLYPFQTNVYLVVVGSLLWVLALLLLLEKGQWRRGRKEGDDAGASGSGGETENTRWQWVAAALEMVLAGLVNRCTKEESQSPAGRVLVMTWLLLCVVMTSVYSSQLTLVLTVQERALPFTSLSQLLDQDEYKWGSVGKTTSMDSLKTSTILNHRRFHEGATTFAKTDPDVMSTNSSIIREKIATEKFAAFFPTRGGFEVLAATTCGITLLPETFMSSIFGFYLQKGSPYTTLFSTQIIRMTDSGLIDFLKRKWTPEKAQCDPDDDHSGRVISLTDTQTAFYLAAAGLGMAALALWLERLRRSGLIPPPRWFRATMVQSYTREKKRSTIVAPSHRLVADP